MKITGINIGKYCQFKNINFDFTYPADCHDTTKRGKPLEKVCFIGQSGTGEPTLLNVIEQYFQATEDAYKTIFKSHSQREVESELAHNFTINVSIQAEVDGTILVFDKDDGTSLSFIEKTDTSDIKNYIHNQFLLCPYIGGSVAGEAERINIRTKNTRRPRQMSIFEKSQETLKTKLVEPSIEDKIIGVRSGIGSKTGEYILNDISQCDSGISLIAQSVISDLETSSPDIIFEKLNNWKFSNPNPRIHLAEEYLSPPLKKFHLYINTENEKGYIQIKSKHGKELSIFDLSTRTRQILATAIPIYKFDTTDTVILFDGPERSLFLDIQRDLVQYYTGLAPTGQFFFATHSPIITAAFEPCERSILDFNEDGEVVCCKGISPIGDNPNDILSADFGMNELMNDDGLAAYQEYRQLGMLIRNETNEEERNKLIIKRVELGNRYIF